MDLNKVEVLKQAQKEHEQAEEEKAAHTDHLLDETGNKLVEREDALGELRAADSKFKEINSDKIREGNQQLEIALTNLEQLNQGYESTRNRIEELKNDIKQIEEIVDGAESVAQKVAKALEETKLQLDEYSKTADELEQKIGSVKKEVSFLAEDPRVQEYKHLNDLINSLESKIADIESDEKVIELLMGNQELGTEGFARAENNIRDSVVSEAIVSLGNSVVLQEKREYVKTLTQKFLTEEFTARGVYKTSNQRERVEQMGKIAKGIRIALKSRFIITGKYSDENTTADMKSGIALANLIGKEVSPNKLMFVMYAENPTIYIRDEAEVKRATRRFVLKHLDTINFLLSQSEGYGRISRDITAVTDTDELRKTLRDIGIGTKKPGEPVLPLGLEELSEFQREAITDNEPMPDGTTFATLKENYASNIERAQRNKMLRLDRERQVLAKLQEEYRVLSEVVMKISSATETLQNLCGGASESSITKTLENIDSTIRTLEDRLNTAKTAQSEHSLSRLPILKRKKHKDLGEDIDSNIKDIENQLQKEKSKKDKIQAAQTDLNPREKESGKIMSRLDIEKKMSQIMDSIRIAEFKVSDLEG